MRSTPFTLAFTLTALCSERVLSQDSSGKEIERIQHSFFVAGPSFTGIIAEDGTELWNSGVAGARDGFVLKNGNVLIAWGAEVKELTREHDLVFHYKKSAENAEILYLIHL